MALEARVEADLAAGRMPRWSASSSSCGPSTRRASGCTAQLMLALYRSGRQAEALEVYRDARRGARRAAGIEPGAELQSLHEAILRQDARARARLPATRLRPPDDRARRRWPARCSASALPAPPNRTIGRAREVGSVGERLRSGSVRLLTLTGPGGVGKTRLALEAARAVEPDFADGAQLRVARGRATAAGRARGDRQRARDHAARGRIGRAGGRALPGRQAAAADRRQLRAPAGRRPVHRRTAGRRVPA